MATRKATTRPKPAKKKKPTLRQIYAKLRKEFTAADLQKYTVIEPMIPMEVVMAQVEEIHRKAEERRATREAKRKAK